MFGQIHLVLPTWHFQLMMWQKPQKRFLLEGVLRSTLEGVSDRRIFPVAELQRFKIITAWYAVFTAALVLHMPGEPPKGVSVGGKANRVALKNFYQGMERG